MPMDKRRYPENWKEISAYIRFERAGGRCEWCGVVHGAVGARDRFGTWHDEDDIHFLNSDVGFSLFGDFPSMVRIVLTTAHLGVPYPDGRPGNKHDKMDVRPENLAALCQRCHLNYDRDEHIQNARRTRLRMKIKAGQLTFLEVEE